ncbi:hypothetical protein PROPEN_01026 [Proteus penneri ATCC 35198]|nr:hypothetical protein PROPEN_01026 [Proteus penneri ATCC 35198]
MYSGIYRRWGLSPRPEINGETIRFKIIRGNHQSTTIFVSSHNHFMTYGYLTIYNKK